MIIVNGVMPDNIKCELMRGIAHYNGHYEAEVMTNALDYIHRLEATIADRNTLLAVMGVTVPDERMVEK